MDNNIKCLTKACENLAIKYDFFDTEQNLLKAAVADGLIFRKNCTPFNSEAAASICKDKEHSYDLLHDKIAMPKTLGFLDYNVNEKYHKYLHYSSLEMVVSKVEAVFNYPVVIKRNSGALGVNVFLCHDRQAVKEAFETIFDHNSRSYDYVALAQEYIPPEQEFRAVFFRGELMLCYQRVSENREFGVCYWDTDKGHALHIDDPKLLAELTAFVQPAFELPGLVYAGFDIIKNRKGEFRLLELNSGPKYNHYIQFYGMNNVIAMYEKILLKELGQK